MHWNSSVFNSSQVRVWLELETELFCQEESEEEKSDSRSWLGISFGMDEDY